MKLQFKEQQYQLDAMNSIVDVFRGCEIAKSTDFYSNPRLWNRETEQQIKYNILSIQNRNNIPSSFRTIDENATSNICARENIEKLEYSLFLDIMMETGTGKTFAFIETIYKLNAEYNISKFIILVPSVAIKQGTIKNINITREYFGQKYNNKKLDIMVHKTINNKRKMPVIPAIDNFLSADTHNISVLIMTRQAYGNEKKNVIYQKQEYLFRNQADTYIDAIADQNPVLIIDEPHRFKSDKNFEQLRRFNAQFILRFGATFGEKGKEGYQNLMYILDSIDAFKQNLVKRIEVTTIGNKDITNNTIKLLSTSTKLRAIISYATREEKIEKVELYKTEDLGEKTNDSRFKGYILDDIFSVEGLKHVVFSNGLKLEEGIEDSISRFKEEEKKILLKTTINYHFERERELFDKGIKSLSLIFIDGVKQYRGNKGEAGTGKLAELFEKLYIERLDEELTMLFTSENYRKHLEFLKQNVHKVHAGYFSEDNSSSDEKIEKDIDIVLNDKEKLLDINEPRRFIFSMWALQEGWDNPNVFTLCKLAPSNSSVTKLQQIGRGLRLAVDKFGNRITSEYDDFDNINMLSVIVPSMEKDFVQDIQNDVKNGNIHNATSIITASILEEMSIVSSNRQANKLIDKLLALKLIKESTLDIDTFIIDYQTNIDKVNEIDDSILSNDEKKILKQYISNSQAVNNKIIKRPDKREKIKINKKNYEKFKELWESLNQNIFYEFNIETEKLVSDVCNELNKNFNNIKDPQTYINFKLTKTILDIPNKSTRDISKILKAETSEYDNKYSVKEILKDIQNKTNISLNTIINIFSNIDKNVYEYFIQNPKKVKDYLIYYIKEAKTDLILQKITYNFNKVSISNTALTKNGTVRDEVSGELGKEILQDFPKETCLYENAIAYDSTIEKDTIKESTHESIIVYAKLPRIKIPVPFGTFSPDFAYVLNKEGQDKSLYLIVETKGYDSMLDSHLSFTEKQKINFIEKFIDNMREQQNIPIYYKTKINQKELSNIIHDILDIK